MQGYIHVVTKHRSYHFCFGTSVSLPFAHLLVIINKLRQNQVITSNHFPSSFDIVNKQLQFLLINPIKNLKAYDSLFLG